ncbi:acid protease, partial [Tothia fuscella]
DGDDGQWSSFHIQIGTPGQTVRLFPSTSASAGSTIWTVISQGCADVNPDLLNCPDRRGYLFQSNVSSTWTTQGIQNGVDGAIFSLNTFEEGKIGRVGNGSYGYDTINLGLSGSNLPTLKNQVIAGIWTNDFFLGSLGLSPVPFNFTNLNEPQTSMLGSLRNQSLIPSSSWAYTAGAYYKTPPVFGSLTLGGYDTTRFRRNNLTFSFGADFSRDLLVSLQSITYDTIASSPLLTTSIDMFIDSMVSEIWLPISICEAFAQRFNLTWNTQGQLYLIEEEAHTALLAQNPKFTFRVGQSGGGGSTVDIVLPYAAFDLNLTAPIVGDTTRYFPLKQARNASQYMLGRTFLQEAYVITDYERRNFSVSQALFPPTSISQNIVAISPSGKEKKDSSGKPSAGLITGIVIAVVVGVALGVWAVIRWKKRTNRQNKRHEMDGRSAVKGEIVKADEDKKMLAEADNNVVHEADGGNAFAGNNVVYEADGGNAVIPELQAGKVEPHIRHELP